MPTLAVTTTQTTAVKLAPALKRKLQAAMRLYADLHAQQKALDHAMAKQKDEVGKILLEAEEQSLTLEGVGKATMVFPVRSQLDKKLFVAQGGSLAQLENATVTTPGKPYVKITPAGEKESD